MNANKTTSNEQPGLSWVAGKISAGWLVIACLLVAAFHPQFARALGVRIPNQDPEAIARGNAFAATADNPSALYYNPAGITQLDGQNIQVGVLNYLGINTTYESAANGTHHTKFHVIPVPEIYYTGSISNTGLAYGLGVYAPFGLGDEWPDDSGFRSIALTAKLQYITLNPVIAYKVLPSLSLAVGPTFNYSKLDIKQGLAAPNDLLQYTGSGVSYGFNAGAMWQPHEQWSFGANYRSSSMMKYSGTTYYNGAPAHTTLKADFPQIVSAGISYRPTPKWNIEADVDWTDWDSFKTLTLTGTSALFGFDLPLALNWHASMFYEFGVTRYLEDGWYVSAGYFFSGETARDKYWNPGIPDTDLHVASIGFGRKTEHWRWNVAGQLIAGPSRSIANSQSNPFTGQNANGSYRLFVPTVSFSVGYHF